jgi:hypothetical protein
MISAGADVALEENVSSMHEDHVAGRPTASGSVSGPLHFTTVSNADELRQILELQSVVRHRHRTHCRLAVL